MSGSVGRRERGETRTLVVVLVAFAILATLIYADRQPSEIRRINHVAEEYAAAWRAGELASLEYDAQSSPDVVTGAPKRADPGRVARRVGFIVRRLASFGGAPTARPPAPRPERVEVMTSAAARTSGDRATARLKVTWRLPLRSGSPQEHPYRWTYLVTLHERLAAGRWRVLWTPQAVHPALHPGQVLALDRSLPPQTSVIGAGDSVLYPVQQGRQPVARMLVSTLTAQVTGTGPSGTGAVGAGPAPGSAPATDALMDLYDRRLVTRAGVQVRTYAADRVTDPVVGEAPRLRAAVESVFSGPPQNTRPVRITLDRRTQGFARAALSAAPGSAAMVVVRPGTGDLLAAAESADDGPGPVTTSAPPSVIGRSLSAPQAPGPVFGLATSLALLRARYTTATLLDCTTPYSQAGRIFTNAQGPSLKDVTLAAAVDGGCVTGLARAAADAPPDALQRAAYDLGIAAPGQDTDGAPGESRIADLLGTPAFHGQVPLGTNALSHAENSVGEGDVLASPLSMARAAATVASGTRRAVRLVVDPPAQQSDLPVALSPTEAQALREIMSKGVTESGGSAQALAPLGDVYALAGTTSHPSTAGGRQQAWCLGYIGDYAFAVLLQDVAGAPAAARAQAVAAASRFVTAVR